MAEEYGFQQMMTTDELDLRLPHAAPFSMATTSGAFLVTIAVTMLLIPQCKVQCI